MLSNVATDLSPAHLAELDRIVTSLDAANRARARAEVTQLRLLAAAGRLAADATAGAALRVKEREMTLRGVAAELAGVSGMSDRAMQRRIDEAGTLVEEFPTVVAAWETGRLTRAHAMLILDAALPLPTPARAAFDVEAVPLCEGRTPGRAKPDLLLLAQHLHPRTPTQRLTDAMHHRSVRVVPLGEGTADLCITMPALAAHSAHDRLTHMARTIIDARTTTTPDTPGPAGAGIAGAAGAAGEGEVRDVRTMDQIRADIAAMLLLTADPHAPTRQPGDGPGLLGAIRATVQIVIPALSLLHHPTHPDQTHGPDGSSGPDGAAHDADRHGITLVGHEPIDRHTAHHLAAGATWWERLITHPVTGTVLAVDGYRRPAALDRWLRARDTHCRFPGCTTPAIRCDLDHTIDHATGGPTRADNLAHLCQRHHSIKHLTPWTVRQHPGGVLEWTSPTGRTHTEHPPPHHVTFTPSEPDETPLPVGKPEALDAPF